MENLKTKQTKQKALTNMSQCTQLEESRRIFSGSTQWFQLNSALEVIESGSHSSGAKCDICCATLRKILKRINTLVFFEKEE